MCPREVTKILVPAYNRIFANKHFRGTVSKAEGVTSRRKQETWCQRNQVGRDSRWGFIKTYKHLF